MRKSRIDESTSKSHRQSRIAVPIKRSTVSQRESSDLRSISAERGLSLKKASIVVPTMHRKRSTSVTPMRTPMRTPSSTRFTHCTTDQKKTPQNDKVWFQRQVNRIFNYIGSIEGVDPNFVQKRDIRLMTINDFLRIMCHLAKLWVPRVSFTSNYADEIYEMLCKLKYPYNFNRSWLKTPNAPHSLNHIVVLIAWLLDGVQEDTEEFDDFIDLGEFPSMPFMKFFQESVSETYQMWNDDRDHDHEIAEAKLDLVNNYLNESVGFSSEKEIQEAIAKLKEECKVLQAESDIWEKKDVGTGKLQQQLKEKQQELKSIRDEIEKKTRDIKLNVEGMASKKKSLEELKARMELVKREWEEHEKEQRSAKHEALLNALHEEKILFQSMVEHLDKVKAIGFDVQIEKSRLLKKLHDITNEVNLSLHCIMKDCPLEVQLDELTLEPNAYDPKKISTIYEKLTIIQDIMSMKIQEKYMQIVGLKNELDLSLRKDIERCEKSLENLTKAFNELDTKMAKLTSTSEHNRAAALGSIERAEKRKKDLHESVEQLKVEIGQEKEKQKNIMKRFQDESEEHLRQKQQLLDQLTKDAEFLRGELKRFGINPDSSKKGT